MLISTQRSLALRCPLCGRLDFHTISLFDFSGQSSIRITCGCGFDKLTIHSKKGREFLIQMPCMICEELHPIKISRQEFWEKPLTVLHCAETDEELGFIGTQGTVEAVIQQKNDNINSIVNNVGFEDYFSNPQIMFETLNHLHTIAKSNQLYCSCGNQHIEIEVYPEKLELHCPVCQSMHIVYAETIDDLLIVKQANAIEMKEKGFTSFNANKVHPHLQT